MMVVIKTMKNKNKGLLVEIGWASFCSKARLTLAGPLSTILLSRLSVLGKIASGILFSAPGVRVRLHCQLFLEFLLYDWLEGAAW